jgi:hypothetical protein
MAQDPFLIDQLDIEPSEAGTRRISRDAGTGGLAFQDAVVTTPITLASLAGLRNIANVLIVGKSGAGAQYTTVQSALDVVPSAASAANPYLVLVLPGVYDETINIVRDGVQLVGLGKPTLRSALEATPDAPGNDHTVIVSAQLGTIPLATLIQGFTITNAHTNKACIRILGGAGSTVGSTGITIRDCDLHANSAVGNRTLWATALNSVLVYGGEWSGANNLDLLLVQEVYGFLVKGVSNLGAVDLRYDTANDQPSLGAGAYRFEDCGAIASNTALATPIAMDLDGGGAGVFLNCHLDGKANFSGDQTVILRGCIAEELNLLETVTVACENSPVKAVTAANATAVLDMPTQVGSEAFAAATTAAVVFDIPMSDTGYKVQLELPSQPVNDETPWITAKLDTGFTINFATNQTMTVLWQATRIA